MALFRLLFLAAVFLFSCPSLSPPLSGSTCLPSPALLHSPRQAPACQCQRDEKADLQLLLLAQSPGLRGNVEIQVLKPNISCS